MNRESTAASILERLGSDQPDVVHEAIREAESQEPLLATPLLELITELTPAAANDSNVSPLAWYLLARFRDGRALESIVRFFERYGEDAVESTGEVATQDLPRILISVSEGELAPIRRLIENERASEWARSAAIEAHVIAVARELLPYAEVEAYLEELMKVRLRWKPNFVWCAVASAVADLGSSKLLPYIVAAYHKGIIDPIAIGEDEVHRDVRAGSEAMIREYRSRGKADLIDDVVRATRWWSFFSERPRRVMKPAPLPAPRPSPGRSSPKVGRNEPCPCGSGKKFKKCCGGPSQ